MSTGAHLFLTGVTGFVGKVVLEELLRRREDLGLDKVYVLIRPKVNRRTGETMPVASRFENELAPSPCFRHLPAGWMQHVEVIPGDLTEPGLGLSADLRASLTGKLTHIVNCAASVEFDLPIADAAAANITSALSMLELARETPALKTFVNVSTAYVSPHPGEGVPVPEAIVKLPFDPETTYQSILAGTADEKALMAQAGLPNTYTLTKCLSENLLAKRKGDVPLSIVRPSIISASWKYPFAGWIDSLAAFAGFVSLIGAGLLKAVAADENTILDVVPCDFVSHRIIQTAFWPASAGPVPLVRHIVTGLDRGGRVETCLTAMESFFQRNPVRNWSMVHKISNGKSLKREHLLYHQLPIKLSSLWFGLTGNAKLKRQSDKLLSKIEYLNRAFPYFTHNSFNFISATPLDIPDFEIKRYTELVCRGVYEHTMQGDPLQTPLAGKRHRHPKPDRKWVNDQPVGNWAIRTAAYVVRKGLRRCTDHITFDRLSFERAMQQAEPGSLLLVIPNHRSYMDFLLCSYLFFSHPELNVPIPQIAAANDFARIPFLGWFFQQTHAFYIRRGQGKADPELTLKIQKLVDQNQTLEFFIEGTRSRARQFLQPRRGLLRALQGTGIPSTILPISFSYDLVPEERAFLRELRAEGNPGMKLSSLLRWTGRMMMGKVHLGRVHIACGAPVIMHKNSDIYAIGSDIMRELQEQTTVSDFHLKVFQSQHPGIELEWLEAAIINRGGRVLKSPLKHTQVDPITERTFRYQWMHHFYPDLLALMPGHPMLEYHVSQNRFVTQAERVTDRDPQLSALLRALFEPMMQAYDHVLSLAEQDSAQLDQLNAKALVKSQPGSFMPYFEEALAALCAEGLLEARTEGKGYSRGPRWGEPRRAVQSLQTQEVERA